MRWTCPHCAAALMVADEKLGNAWSFSRCYRCRSFSLVNKNDPQNVVRVDAPPEQNGKSVLPHDLPGMQEKPVIRPVQSRQRRFLPKEINEVPSVSAALEPKPVPEKFTPKVEAVGISVRGLATAVKPVVQKLKDPSQLPDPLPDEPETMRGPMYFPVGAAIAAMLFVATGVVVFSRGSGSLPSGDVESRVPAALAVIPISPGEITREASILEMTPATPLFSEVHTDDKPSP